MSEAQLHRVAEAMLMAAEMMKPVIEMAEGQRKLLESRGWSPTAAEAYALELLLSVTRMALKGEQSS